MQVHDRVKLVIGDMEDVSGDIEMGKRQGSQQGGENKGQGE